MNFKTATLIYLFLQLPNNYVWQDCTTRQVNFGVLLYLAGTTSLIRQLFDDEEVSPQIQNFVRIIVSLNLGSNML